MNGRESLVESTFVDPLAFEPNTMMPSLFCAGVTVPVVSLVEPVELIA